MHHKEGFQRLRDGYVDEKRVTAQLPGNDHPDAIDMCLDNVAAETVAGAHGALEIDTGSVLPVANGSALECRSDGSSLEPIRPKVPNGQARPVHSDAFTGFEIVECSVDAQLTPGVG